MPPTVDATLPRRAGGFELQREIGRGGMGIVYEAQEIASGRRVALKVLLADHALSDEAFERFRREARVAASISDSRCVFVYGAFQIEGAPAISMELVGGETLEQRITRGVPIPIESAARWTIEILEGLEAASMAGVVHRDVKPSNCFLTEDGQVKVGDFGLARTLEADLRLTLTGQFLGSPYYASPEQVRGRETDLRSDLYSCGATLYAMLTGKAPHAGSNLGEVLARILSETPPSPRDMRAEVPRGLARIVLKALERDPKRRFQTHAEMRAALQPYVAETSMPAHPLRRLVAFCFDLVLALLLADLVPAVPEALGTSWGAPDVAGGPGDEGLIVLGLQSILPVLYFGLCESLWGMTPGKWLLGLRVVGRRVDLVGRLGIATRALVFFGPRLVRDALLAFSIPPFAESPNIVKSAALLLMLGFLATMRRRNGWRAVHELASGTRTIERRLPFTSLARAAPPPTAPLAGYPGMPTRVGDYVIEGAVGRSAVGILLRARDPHLDRTVWMLELDEGRTQVPEERRMLARPGRVRWLTVLEAQGRLYEVFEDPGGTTLLACTALGKGMPFTTLTRLLSSLAQELIAAGEERISLHQLWIDRSWNLRVLDAPAGQEPGPALAPRELMVAAARALLPTKAVLPVDLPEQAEPAARRIFGLDPPFETLAQVRHALAVFEARSPLVPRRTRLLQVAMGTGPLAFLSIVVIAVMLWFTAGSEEHMQQELRARSLVRGTVPVVAGALVDAPEVEKRPLTEDERRARTLLLAAWKRDYGDGLVRLDLNREERAVMQHAAEIHPDPSAEELEWARSAEGPIEAPSPTDGMDMRETVLAIPFTMTLFWGAVAILGAFVLRGGATLGLFEIRVRDRRGRLAARWLCAARTAVATVGVGIVYGLPLVILGVSGFLAGCIALGIAVLVHVALIVLTLRDPARGPVDWLLGTRLVPL